MAFSKKYFHQLFRQNPKAIDRALVVLLERGQLHGQYDDFLNKLARVVKSGKELSDKQRAAVMKPVGKYNTPALLFKWKELAKAAEAKDSEKEFYEKVAQLTFDEFHSIKEKYGPAQKDLFND